MKKGPAVVPPLAAVLAAILASAFGTLFAPSCRVVPAPVLLSLSPGREISTTTSFVLTVRGSNFQANSSVYFNDRAMATNFIGAGELNCRIAAADMAVTPGSAQTVSVPVRVGTPSAGLSNSLSFTVYLYPAFLAPRKIADSTGAYSDTIRPQIALDATGRLFVAWRDRERLYFSASGDSGATWSAPLLVNQGAVFPYRFCLAVDGIAGSACIAWEERSIIYFVRSADGGRTWSARVALTDPAAVTAENPGLFIDPAGNVFLAYPGRAPAGVSPLYFVAVLKSTDGGRSFAALGTVPWFTYFTGDNSPRLLQDKAGLLYLLFASDFGTRYSTNYLAFSTNSGVSWSVPVNIGLNVPSAALDDLNGLDLVGANMYLPYTYKLTFKRSTDRGATWTSYDFADTGFAVPDIALNAFGSVDVVWRGRFVRSFDRGTTWNRVVSFTDDPAADRPSFIEDPSGAVHIVWWKTEGGIYYSSAKGAVP